ncbi:antibiotic biosynthesis monooxygenase [Dactylosporangium sp. AC04546]|uniref:antibiotic biosynthesis monooxygenase family protein n=1 Tax=Dactylosporangium sp. AC04546 TaxID=2862460 RepID=UPI001EDE76D1|nr:antibiotic biosynthesis monooxygenase [Dactylosporangium sp. AC04546]WVK79091.1 antibiotic biosynthesis monooxygenase [Dactylosporangium sp. AC04546]
MNGSHVNYPLVSVIDYPVDGPAAQSSVVEAFAAIQEQWVRHHRGYRSARFLASTGGDRVCALVHWDSEADLRAFEAATDTAGLDAAIARALGGLTGVGAPRLTRYRVVREVLPVRDAG